MQDYQTTVLYGSLQVTIRADTLEELHARASEAIPKKRVGPSGSSALPVLKE